MSPIPSAIGISVAVFLVLVAAVLLAVYFRKRRFASQFKARTFENPKDDIQETQIHSEPEITMSYINGGSTVITNSTD